MEALRRGLGQVRIHYAMGRHWGWGMAAGYREAALQLWQQGLIEFEDFKEIDRLAHTPDEVIDAMNKRDAA